jgi:hypothetical protein
MLLGVATAAEDFQVPDLVVPSIAVLVVDADVLAAPASLTRCAVGGEGAPAIEVGLDTTPPVRVRLARPV